MGDERSIAIRSKIAEVVRRKVHTHSLTRTEAMVLESELCGMPRCSFVDGRQVTIATHRTHVSAILKKVRASGLNDLRNWDELRRTLLRELVEPPSDARRA